MTGYYDGVILNMRMAELTKEFFEQYMESFAGMVKEGFDNAAS